jgi:hypothetical protein
MAPTGARPALQDLKSSLAISLLFEKLGPKPPGYIKMQPKQSHL